MAATMRINEEHDGIELYFPDTERPSSSLRTELKQKFGFRWHHTGKYWYARKTPERMAFVSKLTGEPVKEAPSTAADKPKPGKNTAAPQKETLPAKENTFAAVYDAIGSFPIGDGADMDIHSIPNGMYCKDLNALLRHHWSYDDCICVTDLTNAGKTGKSCTTWRLYAEKRNDIVSNFLSSKENIKNCAELLDALRSGRELESLRVHSSEDKGIEVFTPFQEVKPLAKMPQEWNKRNFTQALLSGQIYMGHVDYHYTDDYALDAAVGFREGVGIYMPGFAREVVEDWCSTYYIYPGTADPQKNTCSINFSEHSNSGKTVYFDLHCDIAEGKRRADEKAAGIEAYNTMMKASCIKLAEESLEENKIYSVTYLDMNANTGVYGTKTEFVQGGYLLEQLAEDLGYLEILSANEQEIIPDKLYEVASFYHPRTYEAPDDRIIDCGNSLQLVTGKALLELTAEGVLLPHIQEATGEYHSIEAARECLKQFVSGQSMFLFSGLKDGGYEKALEKLNREAERAGHPQKRRTGVDSLISAAQNKAAKQSSHSAGKEQDRTR